MNKHITTLLGGACLLGSALAAQAVEVAGNVAIGSDYPFRGVSQTDRDPTIQGGFDVAFESGFYVGTWGSNVSGFVDTSMEWDLYGGFKGTLSDEATYDLRYIDAMVKHHEGALLMSEFVFDIGSPGVGALANEIWDDQAQEIKAMGQWRKAWYPEAPVYPIAYLPGGDPNSMSGLTRMSSEQIAAMQMLNSTPTKETRVNWFLENMLYHHGAALVMAHDALKKSTNPTIIRISRNIIFSQRLEMLRIRQMLRFNGLDKPAYYQYDPLFSI